MTSKGTSLDPFAKIAAFHEQEYERDLFEPQPPQLPRRILPLKPGKKYCFESSKKMSTRAELEKELVRQRRLHEKFMRNMAPPIESKRNTKALKSFDWRIETEEDRLDFTSTLAGKGEWEKVKIPHFGEPLGRAVTYYRTTFRVTRAMMSKGALAICFDGVDYRAHVFVNGALAGSHEGFFAPFEFEIRPHCCVGENTLLVKVENDAICNGNEGWGTPEWWGDKIYAASGLGYDDPARGWHHCPPGMGIYQPVRIEARAPRYVEDIFVRPVLDEERAEVWIEVGNVDLLGHEIDLRLSPL